MAITRKELDAQGCATPLCGHDHSVLFIHPVCHPNAPVSAAYRKVDGVITLRCSKCSTFIADVLVASERSTTADHTAS